MRAASQPCPRAPVVGVGGTVQRLKAENLDVKLERLAQRLVAFVNLNRYVIESDDEAHDAPQKRPIYGRRRSWMIFPEHAAIVIAANRHLEPESVHAGEALLYHSRDFVVGADRRERVDHLVGHQLRHLGPLLLHRHFVQLVGRVAPSVDFKAGTIRSRRSVERDRRFHAADGASERVLILPGAEKAATADLKIVPLRGRPARLRRILFSDSGTRSDRDISA